MLSFRGMCCVTYRVMCAVHVSSVCSECGGGREAMAVSWLLWLTSHKCPEQPHGNLRVAHRPVFCNNATAYIVHCVCTTSTVAL
jgi:hypothetical protein